MAVHVGNTWKDVKGRTWEVTERMPFGMFRVRTTDLSRVGEMRGRDILAEMAKSATRGQP